MASQIAEIALRKQIALKSDEYFDQTKSLGETAFLAFGEHKKSQIRNLENIANSALVVADVLDFIKRQTGRLTKQWGHDDFGKNLLETIDTTLRKNAQDIHAQVMSQISDNQMFDADRRRIHLILCREFIRHLAAHYLYSVGLGKKLKEHRTA